MFVEFYEYDVHPEDRNEYALLVKPDVVYLNSRPCREKDKVDSIVELCYKKFDVAVRLLKEPNYNFKGSRQCSLAMRIRGVDVVLDGNGTNNNIHEFYKQFKRQIEDILNENS
jgi:hypothetical protein